MLHNKLTEAGANPSLLAAGKLIAAQRDVRYIMNCQKIVSRLGTIVKNHIQGSFIICRKLSFLSALNMILHLRIIANESF